MHDTDSRIMQLNLVTAVLRYSTLPCTALLHCYALAMTDIHALLAVPHTPTFHRFVL